MNWEEAPINKALRSSLVAHRRPVERLQKSAKVAADARSSVSELREARNLALAVLHLKRGWKKIDCYGMVGLERGNFDKSLDRLPATILVDPESVNWDAVEKTALDHLYLDLIEKSDDEIVQFAVQSNDAYVAAFSNWKTASLVRDDIAIRLMTGKKPWSNADIARMTGLSTPAVSQIRRGDRNPGRKADAA